MKYKPLTFTVFLSRSQISHPAMSQNYASCHGNASLKCSNLLHWHRPLMMAEKIIQVNSLVFFPVKMSVKSDHTSVPRGTRQLKLTLMSDQLFSVHKSANISLELPSTDLTVFTLYKFWLYHTMLISSFVILCLVHPQQLITHMLWQCKYFTAKCDRFRFHLFTLLWKWKKNNLDVLQILSLQ